MPSQHVGYWSMLPVARDVMDLVPAILPTEGVIRVLSNLREHGVAVLLDSERRPFDILTACDLDKVKKQVEQGLGKEAPASALFEAGGRTVFTVTDEDDLTSVARKIAQHGLATGIVVVDDNGRYRGYLFSAKLRAKATELSREVNDDVRRVKAQYPDAWSSVQQRR
jgi:CBS domain-containing protein